MQDALLEAYRSFKKFQRGTYFDKWLYRIMTNTFIDRQRHRKRVGRVESLDAPLPGKDDGETVGREIPDWADEPSRRVLQDTFDEPIQKALDALQPEFRMVLILSDVEEFSYEEISEMMDIAHRHGPVPPAPRPRHDAAETGGDAARKEQMTLPCVTNGRR